MTDLKWMKNGSRIVGTNLFLLALGLLTVELVFGFWFHPKGLGALNILRNVEYRFDAGPLYSAGNDNISYKRDLFGLRGMDGDASGIGILTIGGSTTDQRYITEGKTWQDILERLLREEGRDIEVVNAGMDGQSTSGEIEDFELWFPNIPNLQVRYVLLYNGINDLFSERTAHYDDVSGEKTIKGFIRSKSVLYDLYQKIRGIFLARYYYPVSHRRVDFDSVRWTSTPLHKDHAELLTRKLGFYEENLALLENDIRKMGAVPIFVTQPSAMFHHRGENIAGVSETMKFQGKDINGVDFFYLLDEINARTMEFCRRVNGICLDLANEIYFQKNDFYDYFHNTPQGTARIGLYLYQNLKDRL